MYIKPRFATLRLTLAFFQRLCTNVSFDPMPVNVVSHILFCFCNLLFQSILVNGPLFKPCTQTDGDQHTVRLGEHAPKCRIQKA